MLYSLQKKNNNKQQIFWILFQLTVGSVTCKYKNFPGKEGKTMAREAFESWIKPPVKLTKCSSMVTEIDSCDETWKESLILREVNFVRLDFVRKAFLWKKFIRWIDHQEMRFSFTLFPVILTFHLSLLKLRLTVGHSALWAFGGFSRTSKKRFGLVVNFCNANTLLSLGLITTW